MPQDLTFSCAGFYIEAMTASETRGFDPGGYFAFDLARGAVHTRHGERVLVLASDVLGPLVSTAVRQGDLTAVRMLGKRIGEDAARSLASDVKAAAPEAVTTHVNGMLSLLGWGTLTLERWGQALVLALEGAPSLDNERLGLAALLGGAFTSLGGRDVACVPVDGTRFVIVHPSIAEAVWSWSKEHKDLASIIARLSPEPAA
ncbi:MAG: hypothetical protein JWN48_837 [Myxococcaceae bacterium]|nr:hypothetical protein [Myxococcaceae bacterium]